MQQQKKLKNSVSLQSNIISGLANIIIDNFTELGQKSRSLLANNQKIKNTQRPSIPNSHTQASFKQ